ncbi:type I-F CRISPR-associated endoribonuclease Cas6/Csy4, partial [Pseudomonas sp. AH2 (2023)]|uniref:type I-F CRISPR-associated endoribonuclease Cas6/Csy4 n=1 Tax=Pseudomonas sp. AH2 (2023) TaxID=3048599 RepID=UPI002B22FDFE
AIGISFADVQRARPALGVRMRLDGSAAGLDVLVGEPWLTGLSSLVQLGVVTGVPDVVIYRYVLRIEVMCCGEGLGRRLLR